MTPDPGAQTEQTAETPGEQEHHPLDRHPLPLGAILAGGASRRFGSPKALARVGGLALIQRVRDSLGAVIPDPVLITRDPELYQGLGLPSRPDMVAGGGPLAGLHAALLWSRERGRHGVLMVACDLPFLRPELLGRILQRAQRSEAKAVAPEGPGRFGVEPLCAWYSATTLPEVEQRLTSGDLSIGRLLLALEVERIPSGEIRGLADPEVLFHNVNTRADHAVAERIARTKGESDGPA